MAKQGQPIAAGDIGQRLDTRLAQTFLTPAQLSQCLKTTNTTTGRLYAL